MNNAEVLEKGVDRAPDNEFEHIVKNIVTINPSLYARYIAELADKNIIEDEYSFLTYSIEGEECVLNDMYVCPEKRNTGLCKRNFDKVEEIARAAGCTSLTGFVAPKANDPERSVAVLYQCGFEMLENRDQLIIFTKNIQDAG